MENKISVFFDCYVIQWRRYSLVLLFGFLLSIAANSQQCVLLDSLLATSKNFHIGKIEGDRFIEQDIKSSKKKNLLSAAIDSLKLNTNNRFYVVYDCKFKKNKLQFKLVEYRKQNTRPPLEGYEFANCATYYRAYNIANFKKQNGVHHFVKWNFE